MNKDVFIFTYTLSLPSLVYFFPSSVVDISLYSNKGCGPFNLDEIPQFESDLHVKKSAVWRNVTRLSLAAAGIDPRHVSLQADSNIGFAALKLSLTLSALVQGLGAKKCIKSRTSMPPCGVLVYFCILKRCAFSTLRHNGQSVS
jgi:hypothetical protein